MDIYFDTTDFKVTEFYTYPTTVVYRINEYDEGFNPGGDEDVRDFFNEMLKIAERKVGRELRDNKIAMKVIHKPTGTTLFVGYKDWNWCVGLKINEHYCGKMIPINDDEEDLETNVISNDDDNSEYSEIFQNFLINRVLYGYELNETGFLEYLSRFYSGLTKDNITDILNWATTHDKYNF